MTDGRDDATTAVRGARAVDVVGRRAGKAFARPDWVVEEVPVALVYNGIAHAVMLATPADLEDFAVGFSLAEGIVDAAAQIYGIECQETSAGITVELDIASQAFMQLKSRRRSMAGRTGCGLCGTERLSEVHRPIPPLASTASAGIAADAIAAAMRGLAPSQRLQGLTGAVHAAGWASPDGQIRLSREDVGRHNALDKLVGALARTGQAAAAGFVVVTSRASFEMVQKAALAGVGLLAAVSAPTALAVDVADQCGLTLAGFARADDLVIYTHPERIAGLEAVALHA